MKRRKNTLRKLASDAAFVAAITLVNRYIEKKESVVVHRERDGEKLNRRLTMVSIVYHLIGVFYNE
jgi:hypothetical protein